MTELPHYADPFYILRKNLVTDWQSKHPPLDVAAWTGHDVRVAAEFYHRSRPETIAALIGFGTKLAQTEGVSNENLDIPHSR